MVSMRADEVVSAWIFARAEGVFSRGMPRISTVVKSNNIEYPLFPTAYKYVAPAHSLSLSFSRNWRGKRPRDERDLFTASGIYLRA